MITLPHYFPISQGEGGDIQQRIASADTLGPIFAAIILRDPEPTKERVGRTDDPQHNNNWDYPID